MSFRIYYKDKALRGRNLSVDSGAKTRSGLGEMAEPQPEEINQLGLALKRQNPRGLGTESPERPPFRYWSFVGSALTLMPVFRRTHVSAFNICMSLFRGLGVAINIQPRGLAP